MVTCTLTCGKVTCILDPPKHWPLGRDVHVNYLSEPQAAQAHYLWVRASEVIWWEYTRIISVLSHAK